VVVFILRFAGVGLFIFQLLLGIAQERFNEGRQTLPLVQLVLVGLEVVDEGEREIDPRFLKRLELSDLVLVFGLHQPRHVLWPFDIFELVVVVVIEIVQLPVVQFGVQHVSYQLVDVLHFTVHVFLEHTEPLGCVKHLEGCHSSEEL
jgi:hypothetical protein